MLNLNKPFYELMAGNIISVYIPETPLLKRDEFGQYTMEQFKKDHPIGATKINDIYDEEEVIFKQGFCFKVKYLRHLFMDSGINIIQIFPECKIEVDFVSNQDCYKNQELFVDCVQIIGNSVDSYRTKLETTRDACDHSYSIDCDLKILECDVFMDE
jgi:hypothetical protein